MQTNNDILTVWVAYKKRDAEVIYIIKCTSLKDTFETTFQMKKENFDPIGMYTYNEMVDLGLLK